MRPLFNPGRATIVSWKARRYYLTNAPKVCKPLELLTVISYDVGSRLGAEVKTVDIESSAGTKLHIVVPVDPDKVDMVEIYDKSGNEISQLSQPGILKDYEDIRVGLNLHLNKKSGFEFRVCLIDITDVPPTRGK